MNYTVRCSLKTHQSIPHSGFAGATPTPDAVGDSGAAGYPETAIARWDVVPYQTFSGEFRVGVVAFHIEGIDHVEFSANGGPWDHAEQMILNPQTGVVEYWTTLDASDFTDGPLEVRAIAVPVNGVPRLLDSLFLNANAGASLPGLIRYVSTSGNDTTGDGTAGNPYATILQAAWSIYQAQGNADGGTIYLGAGSHVWQAISNGADHITSVNRWLTITRNSGLAQSDVILASAAANANGSNDGLNTKLVKIAGITLSFLATGSGKIEDHCWYDDVNMVGPGRAAGVSFRETQFDHKYITNSTISDMQDAPDAIDLYRDTQISTLAQSGFHNSPLVINSSVDDIDRAGDGTLHPDSYQFTGDLGNSIAYGMTVSNTEIAIRMQPAATNVAIVNSNIVSTNQLWEMERPYRHIYVKNSVLAGSFPQDGTFSATNIVFEGCTFPVNTPGLVSGLTIK